MNALKLMEEIYLHPVIQQNVSMQVQLGLPRVIWHNGRLMLRFLPHEEKLENNGLMTYYPAMYDITLDYPSMKLIAFRNFAVLEGVSNNPIAECEIAFLLDKYKNDSEELYRQLSELLEAFSRKELTEKKVDEYNAYFDRLITSAGLQQIYQIQ